MWGSTVVTVQRLRTLPLVVLIALGAGCGGGDEETSATTAPAAPATTVASPTTTPPTTVPATTAPTTTAPPTTTTPATTVPQTAPATAPATTVPGTPEAQLAATALITFEDFAEGWTTNPSEPDDPEDDRLDVLVAECAGVDAALIGDDVLGDRKARSPEFSSLDETYTLEHTVGFAPDAETAALAIEQIGGEALPACYASATQTLFMEEMANPDPTDPLPPGLEIGEVTYEVGDVSTFGLAGQAVWYHFAIPFTIDGQTIESHLDLVFLRNGAALSQVLMGGFGTPFPVEDIGPIVQLADTKLATIA